MPKKVGGLYTTFIDAVCPVPSPKDHHPGETFGVSIPDGKKGVEGEMTECSSVDIEGAPAPGSKAPGF